MSKKCDYMIGKVCVERIRNRNEARVVRLMPEVLAEFLDYRPEDIDVEDIYALTLNRLPPRYVQKGTIILKEPLTDEEIRRELRQAVEQVEKNPTRHNS